MSDISRNFRFALVLVLLSFVFTIEGTAMSFFDRPPEEVVLASPMSGHITLHGKPAINAKVIRKVQQNEGEEFTDENMTDSEGYFELPLLKKDIVLKKFEQYVVRQNIEVIYAGNSYAIWQMKSFSKKEYGELGKKPDNMRCDLSNPDEPVMTENSMMMTKCTWDDMDSYRTTLGDE